MKDKMSSIATRKSRTRTLIQLGGLVEKASLLPFFNIETGDELQSDLEGLEKASAFLGFLICAREEFLKNETSLRKEFEVIGKKSLKYNLYKEA